MPRDGSGQYATPFPPVEEDTTIESAVYNGFVGDVSQDLNFPRPIIAGGTGANNADGALVNLKAEKAAQLVTNFNSHVWITGSFYSEIGATGAPEALYPYNGSVVVHGNGDVTVEARAALGPKNPAFNYVRQQRSGVWGSWGWDLTPMDEVKVNRAGDTMTGPLKLPIAHPTLPEHAVNKSYVDTGVAEGVTSKVSKAGDRMAGQLVMDYANPNIWLRRTAAGQQASIAFSFGDSGRWNLIGADNDTETGGNAGSTFAIQRRNDAGGYLGTPISISRASGVVGFETGITVYGQAYFASGSISGSSPIIMSGDITGKLITSNQAIDKGRFLFGGNQLAYIDYNMAFAGDFYLSHPLRVNGVITGTNAAFLGESIYVGQNNSNYGTIAFGNSLLHYLQYDGARYYMPNGRLDVPSGLQVGASTFSATSNFTPSAAGAINSQVNGGALFYAHAGSTTAHVSFYIPGIWASNLGLGEDGNLYMGGQSFGSAFYKLYTVRDGSMILGTRLVMAADYTHALSSAMAEPYPGAVHTGLKGWTGGGELVVRYRHLQVQLVGGTWVTVAPGS